MSFKTRLREFGKNSTTASTSASTATAMDGSAPTLDHPGVPRQSSHCTSKPPINYCLLSLFQGNDGIRFFLSISILRRCFIGGEGGTTTTPPHHRDRHRHRHRRRLHHLPRPQPQYQPHPEPQPQQQPQPQPQRHKSAQTTSTHVCNPLWPGARPPPPRGLGAAALLRGAPRWRPKGGPVARRPRPSRR